jgi:hypothetical protein
MEQALVEAKRAAVITHGRRSTGRDGGTGDMSGKTVVASLVMVSAAGVLTAALAEAGANVSVGVAVGVPAPPPAVVVGPPVVVVPAPPPPVVIARPPIVVVPGSPVYYAPGVDFNLFVYGGRHYRFHEGHWFVATSYGGPWMFVPRERVPHPVLAVPVTYYRIPPGHARKMAGPGADDHGRKGKSDKQH